MIVSGDICWKEMMMEPKDKDIPKRCFDDISCTADHQDCDRCEYFNRPKGKEKGNAND